MLNVIYILFVASLRLDEFGALKTRKVTWMLVSIIFINNKCELSDRIL